MKVEKFASLDAESTRKIAQRILKSRKTPITVCLHGNLGSGKTIMVQGFAEALGVPRNKVKSPTFTILREYQLEKHKLYHYDFYRSETPDMNLIHELGEYIDEQNYIFIEWPEHVRDFLPEQRIDVFIEYGDNETTREILVHDLYD